MPVATLLREAASGLGGISPIVGTLLTSGGTGTDATSFNTASVTIASGDLVMLIIGGAVGSGSVGTITPSGAGQTWLRPSATFGAKFPDLYPVTTRQAQVWYAIGTAGSGAVTLTAGVTIDSCSWTMVKFTGVDMTNPFVYASMLNTGPNATTLSLYGRQFRNATYNASVGLFMTGSVTDTFVAGSGYTKLGSHDTSPDGLSTAVEYKVGEDVVCDITWTTSVSNGGFVYELRANGSAADAPISCLEIRKGGVTTGATSYTGTTLFGAIPTYASAHPIYLGVYHTRFGGAPTVAATVTGAGVTWVSVATLQFNTNQDRLTVFRTIGPLDGTDITVNVTSTHTGCLGWMVALPGADTTGTNGSGSVVQAVATAASATTVGSSTLAANASVNNGVIAFCASATSGGGSTIRTIPGNGLVTCTHTDQLSANEPTISGPSQRFFAEFMPYNATVCSCTFGASGETCVLAIEVKAA